MRPVGEIVSSGQLLVLHNPLLGAVWELFCFHLTNIFNIQISEPLSSL